MPAVATHADRFQGGRALPWALSGIALAAAAGLALLLTRGPLPVPETATVLPEGNPLPAFRLADHRGEPFTRAELAGRWTLVFFGFASCPDICPLTLARLSDAVERLDDTVEGSDVLGIAFVSVDPARDTPERLAAYASSFGERVLGVTGSPDQLAALAGPLGIYYRLGEGEDYTVEHSAAVLLIDPATRLRAIFAPPHDADAIARDLALILEAG